MKKKIIAVACAVAIVLIALGTVLIVNLVRDRTPPELDAVRDRFEALIERSAEVNRILFGDGLETYPRISEDRVPTSVTFDEETYTIYHYKFEDAGKQIVGYQYYVRVAESQADGSKKYIYYDIQTGELLGTDFAYYRYAEKTREEREGYICYNEETGYYYYDLPEYEEPEFFYTDEDDAYYDYCTPDCGYNNTQDIKKLASGVYSAAYLAPIYENLFTGVAFSDGENGVLYARYRDYVEEGYTYLQKCNMVEGYTLADRRYDYSTMKMAKGSTSKYVIIEIESYIAGNEEKREVIKIEFALENGEWYLDSPTY